MMNIPYEKNRGKACALACYTMVARYYFPEVTFEQIAKISDWEPGYAIWAFKFWLWIMNKGIKIIDYDIIDYEAWVKKGIEGLKKSVSKKEFEFYLNETKNLDAYSEDIKKVFNHKNFTFYKKIPTFFDLESAFKNGSICEVTLDARTLDKKDGFSMHRVVILDITNKNIIFHDPRLNEPKPARIESKELFIKSWLKAVTGPELCIYNK